MERINALAKKAKESALTPSEKEEQNRLRQEYLSKFRESFRGQLEAIEIVDDPVNRELKS
ncbi:MAG: DUF896 domain-containing protein [Clostridiales Family XIII bacterium]|nr:DUF896 domain-containing protein [Clostridiales Family XIII bacterium]